MTVLETLQVEKEGLRIDHKFYSFRSPGDYYSRQSPEVVAGVAPPLYQSCTLTEPGRSVKMILTLDTLDALQARFAQTCPVCYAPALLENLLDPKVQAELRPLYQKFGAFHRLHCHASPISVELGFKMSHGAYGAVRIMGGSPRDPSLGGKGVLGVQGLLCYLDRWEEFPPPNATLVTRQSR